MGLIDYLLKLGAGPDAIAAASGKTVPTAQNPKVERRAEAEQSPSNFKAILEEQKKKPITENTGKTTIDAGVLLGNVYVHVYQQNSGFAADALDNATAYNLEGNWSFHAPRITARLGNIRSPLQSIYKPDRKNARGVIIKVGSDTDGTLLGRVNIVISQLYSREPGGIFNRRY